MLLPTPHVEVVTTGTSVSAVPQASVLEVGYHLKALGSTPMSVGVGAGKVNLLKSSMREAAQIIKQPSGKMDVVYMSTVAPAVGGARAGQTGVEVLHTQRVGAPLPGATLRLDKVQTQMVDGKQVPLYTRVDLHMLEE